MTPRGLLMCVMALAPGCKDKPQTPSPGPSARPASPAATAKTSAPATPACATCHETQQKAWVGSRKARAFGPLHGPLSPGPPVNRPTTIDHPVSGLRYTVSWKGHIPIQEEWALPLIDGEEARALRRQAPDHFVGSGAHTRSYLYRRGAKLFELPLTYYPGSQRWDLSPGYGDNPFRFERGISRQCLACHADPIAALPGEAMGFPLPTGVGCVRCHGDLSAHARAAQAGTPQPVLRLSTLPRARQLDVCDQCHLEGEARILRAGKTIDDYHPGEVLSDTFAVFVRTAQRTQRFAGASHAPRLRLSACYQQSEMTCSTCHTPHGDTPTDAAYWMKTCNACHGQSASGCGAEHGGADPKGCVGCHMARGATTDIPHSATVDHWIRKRPAQSVFEDAPAQLVDFHRPADALTLDLGIGALLAHRQRPAETAFLDQARKRLEEAVQQRPKDPRALRHLAVALERAGDTRAATTRYQEALAAGGDDAQVHGSVGMLLMRERRAGAAAGHLQRAAKARPEALNNLALAYQGSGRLDEAEQVFVEALAALPMDPYLPLNYANHLLNAKRADEAARLLSTKAPLHPRFFAMQYTHGLALLRAGNPAAALTAFRRALALQPEDPAARQGVALSQARSTNPDPATPTSPTPP